MTVCTVTPILSGSCKGPNTAPILLDASSSHSKTHGASQTTHKRRRPSTIPADRSTEKQIQYMLSQLTPEELEAAARVDYEYLQNPGAESPEVFARPMALRYLKSKKDPELALAKMRSTLAFRKDIDMDGLRLAFEDPFSPYSEPLEKMLSSGKNFVQSYDKEGRATHVFVPRMTKKHDSEWTLKESLYTMERAIACSKAADKSVNAVLDFRGFNAITHAPPPALGKDFLLALRSHYAGQVHKIFILDAPAGFAWIWKIFQPFLGKATQDKIIFVSGRKQKEKVLGKYYAPEQATEWMLPQTGKMVDRPLDIQEYLWKTPFNKAFYEGKETM